MFNFFNKTEYQKEYQKEYQVPESPKEPVPITYYRLGIADNNRVTFYMASREISMSAEGVNLMIRQLEFYRDMLEPEQEENDK